MYKDLHVCLYAAVSALLRDEQGHKKVEMLIHS